MAGSSVAVASTQPSPGATEPVTLAARVVATGVVAAVVVVSAAGAAHAAAVSSATSSSVLPRLSHFGLVFIDTSRMSLRVLSIRARG